MTKILEEEIQSTKFRNLHHKAALNIIFTSNWIQYQNMIVFKKYDITGHQYNVLRILRGQHPTPSTILKIKERMLDKVSDTSRIVERLKQAGFVERVLCEADRRAVDVRITKKGLELLKKMEKEEESMDGIMKNLTNVEANQLNHLLDKLRD